jgi:hypothetical protein
MRFGTLHFICIRSEIYMRIIYVVQHPTADRGVYNRLRKLILTIAAICTIANCVGIQPPQAVHPSYHERPSCAMHLTPTSPFGSGHGH